MRTSSGVLGAVVALIWSAHLLGQAQQPSAAPIDDAEWLSRLQRWVAAINTHTIGTLDNAAEEVAAWSIADVQNLGVDVRFLVTLMRNEALDPNAFRLQQQDRNGRISFVRWRFVTRPQSEVLRALAHAEARRGDQNRLLKRGAMLHTDVAMLAPSAEQPAPLAPDPRGRRVRMYFADGRGLKLVDTTPHWNIARGLLDQVLPSPSRDGIVRLWYQAPSAYQQRGEELDPGHLNRALAIFPTDPDVLFFNACLRETYASPAAYGALRVTSLPTGLRLDVGRAESELHQAERLFRQARAQQPGFTEARLRLGRVLGLSGRHQEAADELRRAVAETDDPLLRYYGNLFLGAEESALDHADAARTAYQRAAALYPLAQSPHFGLSQLAHRSRDRAAALAAIEPVFVLPAAAHGRPDPWWDYHVAQRPHSGRAARRLVQVVHVRRSEMSVRVPLLVAATMTAASAPSAQQPAFTAKVEAVRIDALVTDRGKPIVRCTAFQCAAASGRHSYATSVTSPAALFSKSSRAAA